MIPKTHQYIFIFLHEEIQNPDSVQYFEWTQMKQDVETLIIQGHMQDLHEQMQEFYEDYLWRRVESDAAWDFIDFVAQRDVHFGAWTAGRADLMGLVERWMDKNNTRQMLALLTQLGLTGYETDWEHLRATLDEKLRRMEVDGTRNGMKETGYFYCLLHAFTMIMMSAHTRDEKTELLEQFDGNWGFLRYMYSVMTRVIIGFKFANFASLTNCLTNDKGLESYFHLYHSPLKERFNELCAKGTKKEKLEKAFLKLEQCMKQTTPSDELNELCEVLFPEDFKEMLNRHRLPSYQELEKVTASATVTIKELEEKVGQMAQQYTELLEESVTIEQIEAELEKLPTSLSMPIWMQLNILLANNKAWLSQMGSIRDKILAKQQEEMQMNMHITAQAGSVVNGTVQQQTNNGIAANRQISAL